LNSNAKKYKYATFYLKNYLCALLRQEPMPNIKIKDLEFKKLISASKIEEKISELAAQISQDYKDKTPVFLPILNGSFMFASDLLKEIKVPCRVSFVKTSSYAGTSSTGQLKTLIGHDESLFQQHIIILEDIVDTGLTLDKIIEELRERGAKSVEAVSLLRKKLAREKKIDVKYVGFDLENEFVLGYGLDYDGLGRNLKDIYKALDSSTIE
jgi:hypoxanthine phosphoribosyltransferase